VTPLICVSHLRWDFVWQRPQHLLTRLARHYQVFFVEEPMTADEYREHRLDVFPAQHAPDVTIVRLRHPVEKPHHHWIGHGDPRTQTVYEKLLRQFMHERGLKDAVLWLYTPMAAPFVDTIPHKAFVFDAMDQLSAFAGAPPELIAQEAALLPRAHLVFTGGASLYHAKKPMNPRTHLFPSGVDVAHYAPAEHRDQFAAPPEIAALDTPILGFFGVIDERIDLDLLSAVAQARPNWNIVMIGPVVKIDPAALPRHPNLHYPGGRAYAELPQYLAHFDVAILPFALNEATRFISPTKTLEYMAARKPIVSTPIRDVIDLYGEVARIAATPSEFIAQVEAALAQPAHARRAAEDRLLAANAWDTIAAKMVNLMDAAAPTPKAKAAPAVQAGFNPTRERANEWTGATK
jgi:UDP-galactopyranose mutase